MIVKDVLGCEAALHYERHWVYWAFIGTGLSNPPLEGTKEIVEHH